MSRIEDIESQVKELPPDELARFRKWFQEFDSDAWDRQIEADALAERLDTLAEEALRQHRNTAAVIRSRIHCTRQSSVTHSAPAARVDGSRTTTRSHPVPES